VIISILIPYFTTPQPGETFICSLYDCLIFLSPFYIRLLGFMYRGDMHQIDTISPTLTSVPASLSQLGPARRLIVLVPDLASDYTPAIRQIWELATSLRAPVLLLSFCKHPNQEPRLRRALILMSAMMQDGGVHVDVNVEISANWVEVVKRNHVTGDLVVCFAEQPAAIIQKPVSQILQSDLQIPIYILSGLYTPKPKLRLFSQVMFWLGAIGLLVGFLILQVAITQLSKGGMQSILLILSIIPEFWLILFWNSYFG
jgi:hypothetical protein